MSASMSVHSLIDKFSSQEKASKSSGSSASSNTNTNPNTISSTSSASNPSSASRIPQKRPASTSELDNPHTQTQGDNADTEAFHSIDKTGLLSLLGPNVSSFPYSENAFIETVKLRAEQEKTKQDFYRVEIANKNLSIIQTALRAQIPVNLIPLMCVGNTTEGPENAQLQQLQQYQQQQSQPQSQPHSQVQPQSQSHKPSESTHYQKSHSRSSSGGLIRSTMLSDTLNASPVPPINYRFGTGSSSNTSAVRRPLSPAKIGAAAVANLASPTTPYRGVPTTGSSSSRRGRSIQSHQRHFSMPVESPSLRQSRTNTIDLAPAEYPSQQQLSARSKGANLQPLPPPGNPSLQLQSPLGATSTIQVKPSPAQPLHKQSKSTEPPSQESMTSFQHIIQFHHWKPEGPGQGPIIGGGNPFIPQSSQQQNAHKRQKSESMSVDLVSPSETLAPPLPRVPGAGQRQQRSLSSHPTTESRENENEDHDMTVDVDTVSDISNTTAGDSSKLIPRNDANESILDSANPPHISHSRQSSNVGRYPHDILSPSSR
ncbi:predicted protein [Scheffersomyces stipitis CBS 6054]|uniref:Uncharacterized protein n=1 Tax=Scheffersomyces stipitis (strain ATCC 58785 / CBS 6054 / NBRC 10063 / NRRL Y-11545) TaxID=322104 RepID=A3LT41_PICST|nr:predicted protein [Scheffersomyces stipitis CBS 6054]ABN66344.2 predicted protein [Scheffersomyces stipitis CBS 6054]